MQELYKEEFIALSAGKKEPDFEFSPEVWEQAAKWIRNTGYFSPDMLSEQPAQAVINETYRILSTAISSAISVEVPETLTAALNNNAFIFSGFKTYHSLNEVGLSLTTNDGNIKPYNEFKQDVERIDGKYNQNYLYAEYNHAVTSSQMAAKWHDFEEDADRYDLQYRTANDERVRDAHARLHNTTLPVDDPFWNEFLPPNGWNCRCTVVQVRKNKYPESDSKMAVEIGHEITSRPKEKMFRFNAGKQLKLFPDKHPYNKVPDEVKKAVNKLPKPIKTRKALEDEIRNVSENTEWFARGFNQLITTTRRGVNGFTDMNGTIALTGKRMKLCISGVNKIRRKEQITFEEADAIATLWHEIVHNKNKVGRQPMTSQEVRMMELANELVARKTLPEFYEKFGGTIQHPELMEQRVSTGYNRMVCGYIKLIELTKSKQNKVVESVSDQLINKSYMTQEAGLVHAIFKNQTTEKGNGQKLNEEEIRRLVRLCDLYGKDGVEKAFEQLIR